MDLVEWAPLLIEVVAYFAIWSLILACLLEIYARLLAFVGRFPRVLRGVLGFLVYLALAFIIALPLFGVGVSERWESNFRSSGGFLALVIASYLASAIPGYLCFRRRHLARLQSLGYFLPRR